MTFDELWALLPKKRGRPDLVTLSGGTKTPRGLYLTLKRMLEETPLPEAS